MGRGAGGFVIVNLYLSLSQPGHNKSYRSIDRVSTPDGQSFRGDLQPIL